MFRDKVKLISPVSMHLHFGIRNLDYDERKERTISLTERCLKEEIPYERKHDIADAVCMTILNVRLVYLIVLGTNHKIICAHNKCPVPSNFRMRVKS